MKQVKRVSIGEFLALAAATNAATVVDVRERHEFATGSLDGAVNIPLMELSAFLDGRALDEPIVFVCEVGERSLQAAMFAASVGFSDVSSLDGGVRAARTL